MKILTRYFHQLCAVYTVTVLLLLLFNAALGSSLQTTTVNSELFLLLFVFVAVFCGANLLLHYFPVAYVARVLLHCVLTVGGLYGIVYLPTAAGQSSSGKLMMFLLVLLLYWVLMAVYLVLRARKERRSAAQTAAEPSPKNAAAKKSGGKSPQPYQSLFGGKSDTDTPS